MIEMFEAAVEAFLFGGSLALELMALIAGFLLPLLLAFVLVVVGGMVIEETWKKINR